MKKIAAVLFLLFTIAAFPQSTESLKAATKELYQANYLLDFDGIAFLSYPKIAETIGHDEFLKNIESFYENDQYRLRQQLEIVSFQYGKIIKLQGKSFCVITFKNPIRYTFEEKLTPKMAAEQSVSIESLNNTREVVFEPKRNSFNVRKTTTYIAVADETTNMGWKFFNLDIHHYDIFDKIFDESVTKELGL